MAQLRSAGWAAFLTDPGEEMSMSIGSVDRPLQPGDRAPNVVLNTISREGKIALEDFEIAAHY